MKSISCEECKYLTRDVTVEVRVNDLVISSRKFRAYCEKRYTCVFLRMDLCWDALMEKKEKEVKRLAECFLEGL